eukprot:CAMPEP_0171567356 /NCGR_PEP_ID=MMETSP0961-20121227/1112_1 /TAXON_ID=87120 /ORGANISM="Aurantiochytrium limacinum, Strain ATCCMYA-1381" /LENGTH=145 /DNA_ID=CAMNT_0012121263 /DNA_START=295 /DNA_END=732 /DNA_ORIENTATION=-
MSSSSSPSEKDHKKRRCTVHISEEQAKEIEELVNQEGSSFQRRFAVFLKEALHHAKIAHSKGLFQAEPVLSPAARRQMLSRKKRKQRETASESLAPQDITLAPPLNRDAPRGSPLKTTSNQPDMKKKAAKSDNENGDRLHKGVSH